MNRDSSIGDMAVAERATVPNPPPRAALVAAFATVYLVWGSTYLAIRWTLETMPPFAMAGMRFVLAGGILVAVRRLAGDPWPTPREWWAGALAGGLLLLGGNGSVTWSQQHVPSGLAALLVASVPAWMVVMDWLRPGGTAPRGRTLLGLVLGFAGVGILVAPGRMEGAIDPVAAGVLLLGSACWAAGSLRARAAVHAPRSPLMATGVHMASGGALLIVAGLAGGEAARIDPGGFSARSLLAFAYLTLFGSLLAFSCYAWLLRVTTPGRAATYAYVNPVVAVLLGWAFAGEAVTPRTWAAAPLVVAGVALIVSAPASPKR